MTNEVATTQQTRSVLIDMAARYGMEAAAFEETVRATAMRPDARGNIPSKAEFAAFLLVAKEYKLNPLLKEIYAFPAQRGGIVPVVSIDGWVNLVNSNPNNDGFDFTFDHDANGNLISCTCTMHRKDRTRPVVVTEFLSECIRNTDPWKMKHRMLRHKALIQAARYAFGFSGIYDQDEAEKIAEMKDVTPSRPAGPPAPAGTDTAPAPTDAEFVEVKTETKPKAAPKPRAPKPESEPEKVEVQETGKPESDQAAQDEAERREMIEAAGQVYEDDGSTGDPIDAGEVENAEIEDEGDAPSLQDLIERVEELKGRNLPVAVYMSEFNSIAQQASTFEDFQEVYKARRPHNNDKAIVDGHKVIAAAQRARLLPQEDAGQSGTADVTGLNQNIQGTIPWNGPTDYEKRVRAAIDEAKKAWEAKKSSENETPLYRIADDIKLKFESKVLSEKLGNELNAVLGEIIEQF